MSIVKYGNKILRMKLKKLILPDLTIQDKIQEMAKACDEFHGYAVAANQIGWDAQVAVIRLNHITGEEKNLVLINPELVGFSEEEVDFNESCLSLPSLYVNIRRPDEVRVRNYNFEGIEEIVEAKGLLARVIQHEMDHLLGKLIVDYMTPIQKLMAENKLKRIKRN